MANKSAILSVKIVTDAKEGAKGLDQYEGRLKKFEGGAKKLAAPAAAVLAGLGAAAIAAGNLAAEAEQNVGAVQTVFGKAAGSVLDFADTAATAVGMSASSYNSLAASIGGSLASAGWSADEMAAKTQGLIEASADLSSVFGGDAAEAAAAMGAGLRGEFDSLERFGIFMNMNAVNAELAANGQDKLTGAAADAAKKQTITNMIMEQAGKYAGNFAREADTAAGAQQRATAQFEDAATQLGEQLLPIMTRASELGAQMATWISNNIPLVTAFAIGIGALAATVLLVNGAIMVINATMAIWRGAVAVATAVQWAWNAAMSANPIGIVIILIAALVAGIIWAYNNVGWFKDAMDFMGQVAVAVWNTLVGWVQTAIGWLDSVLAPIGGIQGAFELLKAGAVLVWETVIGWVEDAIGWLDDVLAPIGGIEGAFSTMGDIAGGVLDGIIGGIRDVIGWAQDAIGWIASLFGKQDSAAGRQAALPDRVTGSWYLKPAYDVPADGQPFYMTAAEPTLRAPATWAAGTTGPAAGRHVTVNVTFTGLVTDRVGTAREIRRVLAEADALVGA